MRHRIESLDYLRGALALGVLLYHFATWDQWSVGDFGHDVLQRLGIYAVCSFYVISGISFGYVYRDLPLRLPEIRSFWIKRYFRLAPLYFLTLLVVLALALLRGSPPGPGAILLNASLLFGLLDPSASLVTGGWSIGNEMAFYLAFPLIILALRRGRVAFAAVLAGSVLAAAWFAFVALSPDRPLAAQWTAYINPLNHLFLFVAGVGVSAWIRAEPRLARRSTAVLFALFAAAFCLLPVAGDSISLVTGWTRLAYSAVCIGLCGAAAVGDLPLGATLQRPAAMLGQASYSVYLLHPIVYAATDIGLRVAGVPVAPSSVALPVTLAGSYLVYHHFEAPMVALGRRVAGGTRRPAATTAADPVAP